MIYRYMYEDDLQLGKLKETVCYSSFIANCVSLSQTNVSEPQTGIEPATF